MKSCVYLWAFGLLAFASSSAQAVEGSFTYEGVANCRQPKLTNYPIRGAGTSELRQDRSAVLSTIDSVGGGERVEGKLGGPAVEAKNGSIKLNVGARNRLRITRDLPNQIALIDIKFVGRTCEISLTEKLKPGKTEYTYPTAFGVAYCDRVKFTKSTCTVKQ